MFADAYKGRRVLVTGHTGFKGSWLAAWLTRLGAVVAGFADGVPTSPSHYEAMGLGTHLEADLRGDIRDREGMVRALRQFRPEVVFHLAAQARAQSGTMRSWAQSPPPMTLPARTVAQAGPSLKKLVK